MWSAKFRRKAGCQFVPELFVCYQRHFDTVTDLLKEFIGNVSVNSDYATVENAFFRVSAADIILIQKVEIT
jgi:hypothetical protein